MVFRVVVDGRVILGEEVQVKVFDKTTEPKVSNSGIGKRYTFSEKKELDVSKYLHL